jgi:integrase/recombinase XerD
MKTINERVRSPHDKLILFLAYHLNLSPREIVNLKTGDITDQAVHVTGQKSESHQNSIISAVKFCYKAIYNRTIDEHYLVRPQKSNRLPDVLDRDEIVAIYGQLENKKHKLLITLIYSAGLRRSEVQDLKLRDINIKAGLLFIRDAKGNKDRITVLSAKLTGLLRAYLEEYKPTRYLFEGTGRRKI